MIGRTLQNRYLINRLLSKQGGFSDTYIAQDLQLPGHPDCVVKHFKPKFDRDGSRILPDDLLIAKQYFDREADKLMILGRYDRIPSLFAKFEEGGEFFIVMEHINGRPLSLEIGQGERWDEMAVVQLLVDLLSVLAVVHQHPLIHRDIKPDNILRRRSDDQLVLIDFGGVKEVATGEYSQAQLIQDPRSLFLGSKGYIAPEQSIGEARLQSDLYAVGIIALQALTGLPALKLPRDGQGRFVYQPLVQVSDRLQSVLGKLTAPDWRERYSDAAAAWETIQQMFLSSQAPTVRVGSVPPPPPSPQEPVKQPWREAPTELVSPPPHPRTGLRKRLGRWFSNFVDDLTAELDNSEQSQFVQTDHVTWNDRGNELFHLGRYEEAIASCDKAIQFKPDYHIAWHNRGLALNELGRYEEAIASCDKAIQFKPDDHVAWHSRGVALNELGRYEEAIASYDKAIQFKPDSHYPWYGKAVCYVKQGQVDKAIDHLRQAIKLNSQARDWAKTNSAFAPIRQDPRFQALIQEP
ncbi:tetratricopeptide repeat protein [Limnothrix sp. FACHB-708]|uniref:serine/threonine-protein kinase n=1 Tax=Limnothrix sp. FACHB-708 TaxID=2692818 RepID=UPI00168339E6|nr:serine/threonine-protein kinase [Limnothrix sp. FACHB-708]MBD2553871.1 tetratricopeptide repeat protein [Limnothrix sp. FACHB-708]